MLQHSQARSNVGVLLGSGQVPPGQPGKSFACGLDVWVWTRLCVCLLEGTRVFIRARAQRGGQGAERVSVLAGSGLGGQRCARDSLRACTPSTLISCAEILAGTQRSHRAAC